MAITIAVLRLRTYYEPLETDLTIYMSAGHTINAGGRLYADAYEPKPPVLRPLYALAERMAG
jgi:hypothetical protein